MPHELKVPESRIAGRKRSPPKHFQEERNKRIDSCRGSEEGDRDSGHSTLIQISLGNHSSRAPKPMGHNHSAWVTLPQEGPIIFISVERFLHRRTLGQGESLELFSFHFDYCKQWTNWHGREKTLHESLNAMY